MRTSRLLTILVVAALPFLGLLVADCSSSTQRAALSGMTAGSHAAPGSPEPAQCFLFGAEHRFHDESQLMVSDLHNQTSRTLGLRTRHELVGLAIDDKQILYGVSEGDEHDPAQLFVVDTSTGTLRVVGPIGFRELHGLAFRSTDRSLWAWAEDEGLVSINRATGAGSLALAKRHAEIASLSWSIDGSRLYTLGEHGRLSAYHSGTTDLTPLSDRLPEHGRAIQVRPDGNLLVLDRPRRWLLQPHDDDSAAFVVYNLQTHKAAHEFRVPTSTDDLDVFAWPNRCGNPDPGGQVPMIRAVTLDKTVVCPNDEVAITVTADHPDGPPNQVDVAVNQFLGATQYVQVTGNPGVRRLAVTASTFEGYVDYKEASVTVERCLPVAMPVVRMNPSIYRPDTVEFTITNATDLPTTPTFHWDFGDGATATTTALYMTHDYSAHIDPTALHTYFTASVTLQGGQTTKKSLALMGRYAFNKRLGILQPPVNSGAVSTIGGNIVGTVSIQNLGPTPITLAATRLEYQPCDNTQPSTSHPFSDSFSMAAGAQLQRQITLGSVSAFGPGVCGVAIHYAGTDASGMPALAHVYYELRDNLAKRTRVTNAATIQTLKQVASLNALANDAVITDEDIHALVRAGKIAGLTHAASSLAPRTENTRPLDGPVPEPQSCNDLKEPVLGDPCNPACAPIRPGLVCSVSDSDTWVRDPPHIQNAQKGDVVMSPGCGKIGALLHSIGQHFSHMGIMTRDLYEVTNSTASEDVLNDDAAHDGVGGAAGINPLYLKWAWPGAIRQSVDEAYNSGSNLIFVIGSDQVVWNERPLSSDPVACSGDAQLFYPLVARVDPALRAQLQQVADRAGQAADNISRFPDNFFESQFHYRFYSYSNGAIGALGNTQFLSKAIHSQGSRPSVCSSFVWNLLGDSSVPVSLREPDANNMGVYTAPGSLPGLAHYSADQRTTAAVALYNSIYNSVLDKGGLLGQIASAPTSYAMQMVNCFAFDNCEHDGSGTQWIDFPTGKINVGDGDAISPDHLLLWNIYPTNEPIVFRDGRYRRPFTWHAASGTGCISGQVTNANGPVAGSTVQIVGLQRRDGENVAVQSDGTGRYSLQAIPILAGGATYLATAQATIPGIGFEEASARVNAAAPSCAVQDFALQPPAALYRRVTICGGLNVQDNRNQSHDGTTIVCNLNQADPAQHVGATLSATGGASSDSPGSTIIKYHATHDASASCKLNPDNSVTVVLDNILSHCDATFPSACGSQVLQIRQDTFTLPPQQGRSFSAHLQNANNDIWSNVSLFMFNDCRDCNTPVSCPKP